MTIRNTKLIIGAAWLLAVACVAAAASAADKQEGGGAIAGMCQATGFNEECGKVDINEAKKAIKKAFDAAVAELEIAIKNTTFYQKIEKDRLQRSALNVCEQVLQTSIDELERSFEKIAEFKIGQMDNILGVVRIWVSGALTSEQTCSDAFAKTRGGSGRVVRQMLKKSDALLKKALHMVVEFQNNFESIKKDLGEIVESIKAPGKEGIPDFVKGQARKLIESPRMSLPPNVVVAQDGSGQFKTITEAVNTVPLNSETPFVILVKAGVYGEYVWIQKNVDNVIMVGEGPLKTRISGNLSHAKGISTFNQGTLRVDGMRFILKDIGVVNTAGPIEEQAVAIRASGDMGVYYNVHADGYQDTLYAQQDRQFFRECRISGTVDFIFGNGVSVFQKCEMVVHKPDPNQRNMVTAEGRETLDGPGMIVIQACNITAEKELEEANPPFISFLGRPWKPYSRTIYLQSTIGGFIDPSGWAEWMGTMHLDTLHYVEYNNYGPGADLSKRVTWKGIHKITTDDEARFYLPRKNYNQDDWILESGVPYNPEFV